MPTFLLILFLLLFPALALWAEKHLRPVRFLGSIVLCYLTGLLLGNLPGLTLNSGVLKEFSEISVSLAVPCLLFSARLSLALRYARRSLLSFFFCMLAVSISASLAWFLFREKLPEAAVLAGMLAGVYTGGTPNLSAVGIALGASHELFILTNTIDMVLSGSYLLFLLTIARPLLVRWLPDSKPAPAEVGIYALDSNAEQKPSPGSTAIILIFAALILALSAGLAFLLSGSLSAPLVILGLSTLGLLASALPFIQRLKGTYAVATYLLLVFSLAVGSLANIESLLQASPQILAFCGFSMLGAVLLHYLLARIFSIDVDTVLVTSTAAIFGPVFVGPVLNRLPSKQLLVPGIAVGMLGYAAGNYLGIGLSWLLQWLG